MREALSVRESEANPGQPFRNGVLVYEEGN